MTLHNGTRHHLSDQHERVSKTKRGKGISEVYDAFAETDWV